MTSAGKYTTPNVPLTGLTPAPAQQFGAVRMIPLLRKDAPGDLRLARRRVDAETVHVGDDIYYSSFMPHAYVVGWSDDGRPLAASGAQLRPPKSREKPRATPLVHRMAKREDRNLLRFMPLHLAMEGFLALHFRGPDVAWTEYSREALARGLSPRFERSVAGLWIAGLAEALRVFEIHDDQVGVLVFVADALASAFVVPHPDDYRELHRSLLGDFYGELLYQYGMLYRDVHSFDLELRETTIHSLADLRAAVAAGRSEWHEISAAMTTGLLARETRWTDVYRAGKFQLARFIGALDPDSESHIGEAIRRDDGTVEYLKTFRLSAAQVRRAFLLDRLASHDWDLARCAESLGDTVPALCRRLVNNGFGYILKPHIVRGL